MSESTLASRINAARQARRRQRRGAAPDQDDPAQGHPLAGEVREEIAAAPAEAPPAGQAGAERHLLQGGGRRASRRCVERQRVAGGQSRQLAEPPRIRPGRARSGLRLISLIVGQVPADPLRRARQRPVRLGGRRHFLRGLRARSRSGGGRTGSRALCAARHLAGRGGFDRLRDAPSRTGVAPDPVRRICARLAQARRAQSTSPSARRSKLWSCTAGGATIPPSGRSSPRCSFPAARPNRCNGSTTCSASARRRRTPSRFMRTFGDIDVVELLPKISRAHAGPAQPRRRPRSFRGRPDRWRNQFRARASSGSTAIIT